MQKRAKITLFFVLSVVMFTVLVFVDGLFSGSTTGASIITPPKNSRESQLPVVSLKSVNNVEVNAAGEIASQDKRILVTNLKLGGR